MCAGCQHLAPCVPIFLYVLAVSAKSVPYELATFAHSHPSISSALLSKLVLPTCSVLQDLAIHQLLQNQMLPYLIAGPAAVSVAVDRASRVMAELSTVQGLIQGQCTD